MSTDIYGHITNVKYIRTYDGGTKATVDWCTQQELFYKTDWYIKTQGETKAMDKGDL